MVESQLNPNAVFVAADGWLALLSKTDAYKTRAMRLLQQLDERDCALVTSSAVVLEVGNELATRDLRQFARLFRALLEAPRVEVVVVDGNWLDAGWQWFQLNPEVRWTLTDCLSFAIMRQYELRDAFSLEPNFEQAGFRALLRQP